MEAFDRKKKISLHVTSAHVARTIGVDGPVISRTAGALFLSVSHRQTDRPADRQIER